MNDDLYYVLGGQPYNCLVAFGEATNFIYWFTPWVVTDRYTNGEYEMLAERGAWRAPNGRRMTTKQISRWASKRTYNTSIWKFIPKTVQE